MINQSNNPKITTYKNDQRCTTNLKAKIKSKDNVQNVKTNQKKLIKTVIFKSFVWLTECQFLKWRWQTICRSAHWNESAKNVLLMYRLWKILLYNMSMLEDFGITIVKRNEWQLHDAVNYTRKIGDKRIHLAAGHLVVRLITECVHLPQCDAVPPHITCTRELAIVYRLRSIPVHDSKSQKQENKEKLSFIC